MNQVRVLWGDTDSSPYGTGSYASRGAVMAGGAAITTCRVIKEKAHRIAAHLLEANPAQVVDQSDGITIRNQPGLRVSMAEIARAAYGGAKRLPKGMEPGLEATCFYDPYYGTASYATHGAVVEIDRETFAVRIIRYVVCDDCGRVINPLIVDGQQTGGVMQGVGGALLEEVVYDEQGQLLTGSLMDYLVPCAADAFSVDLCHLENPSPTSLGGFRGVGESGTIGAAAAVANAINDALEPLGVELSELPITPGRIFEAVQRRGQPSDKANASAPA
jgi:aerobic carbon-monoxide dehydrogenase large subunit